LISKGYSKTRWLLPDSEEAEVLRFAASVGLRQPAARVLWQRGFRDGEAVERFLRPSTSHLHNPMRMRDMDRAVARLVRAVQTGEPILLYGDYDVDGTSAIVVLLKALELAGARATYFVPHRIRDGYGMRPEVIDRAARDGVKLVVSVDTGIRAASVVEHARALGVDVIVTDHHLPETGALPNACAVLNPNRPDCEYPEKNLCGAAVAFKLVQALMPALGWSDARVASLTQSFLKMVAVATVADVVPLCGENRAIVKLGLAGFGTVRNPGLRALLRVAGFDDGQTPSAGQVAFRVAPRINAAGRMASAEDVIELFLTADEERARGLAQSLHDLNKDRQETEAAIVKAIEEECLRVAVTTNERALLFSAPGWHKGVVGIVASRIVERYHRPVFVLSEDPEAGIASGSGRSVPGFHLLQALESMPDLFDKFGGHKQAAGVTLPAQRVAEFRSRFNELALGVLSEDDLQPRLEIDAVLNAAELDDRAAAEVLSLAPFGFGNPAPVFALRGAELAAAPIRRSDKLITACLKQTNKVTFVKCWTPEGELDSLQAGTRVNAAISIEEDSYSASRGYGPWSAVLKDLQLAGQAAVVNG
jgi:single-stranded-DNA-specific exonuclease